MVEGDKTNNSLTAGTIMVMKIVDEENGHIQFKSSGNWYGFGYGRKRGPRFEHEGTYQHTEARLLDVGDL